MLAAMKGGSDRWHIFRGQDARDFLNGLVLVAQWPVTMKLRTHGREVGKLFLTDRNACVLVLDNETVPDIVAKSIYKHALRAADESERRKSAAN